MEARTVVPLRWLLAAVLVAVPACGTTAAPGVCAALPTPNVSTVEGWVGYLAAHRDDVAFAVDDGRGSRMEHRADAVQPMASASKALNLAAYARAVAVGAVDPDEPVRLGDWERWEVFNLSETAHARALDSLGIPRRGNRALDPNRTVTIDQLAQQVSIWSDDAGPDYLRARLGDQALLDTARAVGWADPELISTTGFLVSLYTPELVPPAIDRPARRAAEWTLARRYATEPAFRAGADSRTVGPDVEGRWADGGPGGTARQLSALWSAVGHGTFPGSDRARALAEQDPDPGPGIVGLGVKGGSLTGVLARGIELRRKRRQRRHCSHARAPHERPGHPTGRRIQPSVQRLPHRLCRGCRDHHGPALPLNPHAARHCRSSVVPHQNHGSDTGLDILFSLDGAPYAHSVTLSISNVVINCGHPQRLAEFWARALEMDVLEDYGTYVQLGRPDSPVGVGLQRVPEPRVGRNRVHFDLHGEQREAAAGRLASLGATIEGEERPPGLDLVWTVLTDPEGNEFCIG